ncbi:MAG: hypothetical protein ACOYKP_04085 [Polynucleobacter sp.]
MSPVKTFFVGKKPRKKRGLVMLGGSGEIDCVETSFSNSRPTDYTAFIYF